MSACNEYSSIETNLSEEILPFEFTTQDNETLSNEDLEGKWWIADMVFTNCTTICLPMTTNMSTLQDLLEEEGLNDEVDLVSFSVDPDYDTPEVLKEYALGYDANLENWTFLTGYDFETIKKISVKSFKSLLGEDPTDDTQFIHGTGFFLVDPEGKVIKKYNGTLSTEMELIVNDLEKLLK
ncbi:SCO family protein [Ornithinibacillus halophilus]|uniref:SCO family protein n=1 Tax=Ornithinibacillus halophilus TaxID=930117 RepID=UPI001F2F2745|nr:SCO family protein [Ornithinibacillus halophilus]